jgi:hypothetical protein
MTAIADMSSRTMAYAGRTTCTGTSAASGVRSRHGIGRNENSVQRQSERKGG